MKTRYALAICGAAALFVAALENPAHAGRIKDAPVVSEASKSMALMMWGQKRCGYDFKIPDDADLRAAAVEVSAESAEGNKITADMAKFYDWMNDNAEVGGVRNTCKLMYEARPDLFE